MRIFKEGGHRLFESDPQTVAAVGEMLLDLEKNGMDAVRKYSERFDGWNPKSFELSEAETAEAAAKVPEQIRRDTEYSQANVRKFAQAQMEMFRDIEIEVRPGAVLGHKNIPVRSVCSYIPGGRYPLFGSAQMSIIPPKVAGVRNVYAFTPPVKGGGYYPATVNAMKTAGADRIFILGGVPALAMAAFGMEGGGIDLLAGPSEVVIIADGGSDPALVACDLLGQAEHDVNSGLALICFDEGYAQKCMDELAKQLATLGTKDVAEQSWSRYGTVYIAEDIDEAIKISDDWAPEHLELLVRGADQQKYLDGLRNYGSLFVGEETTVAYGDKTIGTNHILPTSRAARYTGGVWVGKFIKTLTYQRCTPAASREIGEVVYRQCVAEQLPGHAATAKTRAEKYK